MTAAASEAASGAAAAGVEETVAGETGAGETYAFPASFAQQRLWFLDQLEPENPFYNMPAAVRMGGPLSLAALRQTLGEVVRRHEVLRTTLASDDGQPVQVVHPPRPATLPLVDLSHLDPEAREAELWRLARGEARRPFDLAAGPLLRVTALRLAAADHAVLTTVHHVISDGWSSDVLSREVQRLYDAFAAGRPSPLPELPLQYADFAVWQREWLSGPRLERQVDFWRRTLAGAPPLLELPTDRPRPSLQSYRGARVRFTLPGPVAQALRAVGAAEGATPFMVYLAAFQVLLLRTARQTDVLVGTDVAGRNRAELEDLIGFFVNQLVVRTDLSGAPSFRRAVGRVKEATLGAYDHQDLPFERLVDELDLERDLSRHPLFQVSFVLQNTPRRGDGGTGGFTSRPLRVDVGVNRFDLTLTLHEGAREVAANLDYARDLFDASTIEALARRFRRLCAAAAAHPDSPVGSLPLLDPAERQQVLGEWNDTAVARRRDGAPWRLDAPVQVLIQEVARRWPDRVAAVCGGAHLSYGELERRVEGWSAALARRGVGEEDLVALFVHRGFDLLTAILAVFRAGAAYLPLDPVYPAGRVAQVLGQSRCRLALVGDDLEGEMAAALAELAPGRPAPRSLTVSALAAEAARLDGDGGPAAERNRPVLRNRPASLAYVFYTSGSTGRPKGAMCDQRGLVNHLWAKIDELALDADDRLAQTASAAFDISVWQYLAPLVLGGSTHVFPDAVMHDGGRLLEALAEQRITMLEMVPSPLRALLDQAEAEGRAKPLPALRWLVATGEALPPALVRRWLGLFPRATVVNAWGATETSDDVTHHAVATPPPAEARQIPVGRPAGNCSVLVLEPSLEPAPPGVPGELYIGGVMVGRGYHRDPARTALAFVPHPLPAEPGERLYRTGDLGRWSRDGVVEFLGRVDHQVKIRGFRVELGEVQAVLAQHPAVDEVVVLDRDHPPGVKRLVAYVVAGSAAAGGGAGGVEAGVDTGVDTAELREFLRQRLPEYMVPAFFLFLDALPVTPNGKVNRRALLALELPERGGGEGEVVAPRNPVEAALAEIWAEVLRLERVSVEDNFFALGGDSILSIQIVAKAARAGLRVTPRQLFTHQTVAELAAAVTVRDDETAVEAAPAPPGPFPLTPVQRRFFHLGYADPQHYNQSMLLAVHRPLAPAAFSAAVAAVVERHDALRQRFHAAADAAPDGADPDADPTADVAAEVVAPGGPPPAHRLDLSALPPQRHAAAVEAAAAALQASLSLDVGPLARFAYFALAAGDEAGDEAPGGGPPADRLLLALHHLAVDGVSWPVLLEDLQSAHAQAAAGTAPVLPPVPTSYRDWASEVAAYAASPRLAAEAPFWLDQAQRAAARQRPLRRDGADPSPAANRVGTEVTVARLFDGDETAALLRELPERYGAAVEDALLAALVVGHRRWSGAPALWLDVEGHGREEVVTGRDLSRTVGWFTAIYPLLLTAESPDDPVATLLAVKEAVRRVPHRGVGYGSLRWAPAGDGTAADVARRLAAAPTPEIIFNYHGQVAGGGRDGAERDGGGEAAASPVFTAAAESDGPSQSPRARRAHLFEVTAAIGGGRLRLAWTYPRDVFRPASVDALADLCADALRQLVDRLRGRGEAAYTPSDFDLVDLDQGQLDKVLAAVRGGSGEGSDS